MTAVVNIRKKKGQPISKYDVLIDRRTIFGNPFQIGRDGDRFQVLEKYRWYFICRVNKDAEFKKKVMELKDKVLGCWCVPLECHGSVIVEYLDNGFVIVSDDRRDGKHMRGEA